MIRRVAERFEIYACGVELANGFGELTDAAEQRRRFAIEMDEKARLYGERYPLDEDFLAALELMPEASGIALGFDRVVMLATHAPAHRRRALGAGGGVATTLSSQAARQRLRSCLPISDEALDRPGSAACAKA